jgi:hypothetical protein
VVIYIGAHQDESSLRGGDLGWAEDNESNVGFLPVWHMIAGHEGQPK